MANSLGANLPFFVAEISANHLGNLERAHHLIEAAAGANADAVKFQTYTAETMTLNLDSLGVSANHALWGGKKLFDLYQEAHTPWEWHSELFSHALSLGLIPFSSPFDSSAVEFLEKLNCPIYKIASLESGDLELIKEVGRTGKPTIISTGATQLDEIEEAVSAFLSTGNEDLTLLVCTSSYPAEPNEAHLNRISTLKNAFSVNVGISDHTLGIGVSIAAIALGATVIEKHITLKRSDGGHDSAFSMEPSEFEQLVLEGNNAKLSLGNLEWKIMDSESESRRLRRSLYVVSDVLMGEELSPINIRAIRPGAGLKPKYFNEVIGRKFNKNLKAGTPLSLEDLV
jgi:N-acetylneuraminate synthase